MARYGNALREFGHGVVHRWLRHGPGHVWTYVRCRLTNACLFRLGRWTRARRVECPLCGWTGLDFFMIDCGAFAVPGAECPQCRAQERQRMLHLYFHRCNPDFSSAHGIAVHCAPEEALLRLSQENPALKWVCTDVARTAVDRFARPAFQADLQYLPLRTDSVDFLFCLHVLEHISNDRAGIAEIHRVLKPGGTAYIMVPFMMGWERTREFGAPDPTIFDHVRGYSPCDFRERLCAFQFEEVFPESFLTAAETARFGTPRSQILYRCVKSAPPD